MFINPVIVLIENDSNMSKKKTKVHHLSVYMFQFFVILIFEVLILLSLKTYSLILLPK